MRVSFHMSLGTGDEKEDFCGLLKLPYSIFKNKQANGTEKAFLALTTSRPPLAAPFAHRRYSHHGMVLIWRTTLESDAATKILSKKRKMAAVSATSCGWSKLSRDQNNGFNITSTLCPPACLLPPFLPCAVAEVICLLGTEKHCSRPGSKVWDLRDPSLEQLSSILGCHPRLSSFQVYQFLFAKRDYRTKLTTAELRQFGLETELILIERGKKPHPPKLLKNSFKTIKIMRIINITFQ